MSTTKVFKALGGDFPERPRILLVEDDPAMMRVLQRKLASIYDVTAVDDGIKAADLLDKEFFDVILSDILLPGMSGVDLLRLVRSYDLDIPVILMTAKPVLDTVIEAVELGAFRYLTKPFDSEVLMQTLGRAASLSRLARTKREAIEELETPIHPLGATLIGDRAGFSVRFARALEKLELYFQPIIDPMERKVVAYEALMRSHEESLPTPSAVLDAAERLGLIEVLGRHVRRLAAAAIPRMPADALLFVNLHSIELIDDDLYDPQAPLTAFAKRIVLEVTERASLDSVTDIVIRARRLRDLGYQIAIDDLGAGYAGLATFAVLEPEVVKLDMSLVRGIDKSVTKQRLVRSMVALCREMNMRIVAEGVETREELAILNDIGCDLLQGYFFARPEPRFARVTF